MKITKKLGKMVTGIIISLKALAFKVYAVSIDDMHMQTDYGVQLEPKPTLAVNIASTIIIPIVLLIGIIIYCIKSTSSVLKKAIVSIGVILAYILIRVLMKNVF